MNMRLKTFAITLGLVASNTALLAQTTDSRNLGDNYNSYNSNISPYTFYLAIGANADVPLNDGYETPLLKRDPRVDFSIEVGTSIFAIPLHYSRAQDVDILGLKPRFQFLFPLGSNRILVGPGVGAVFNYWHSGFDVLGSEIAANVFEMGAQGSLQAVIRPVGPFIITLTPVAIDFNFWRKAWISKDQKRVGNFSTTDNELGIIYSGGIGVGIGF